MSATKADLEIRFARAKKESDVAIARMEEKIAALEQSIAKLIDQRFLTVLLPAVSSAMERAAKAYAQEPQVLAQGLYDIYKKQPKRQ